MVGVSIAASAAVQTTGCPASSRRPPVASELYIRGVNDDHRHIVVTDDFVAIEGPESYEATFPLSDLRRVDADDSICLAYFGNRSTLSSRVYAMSENRSQPRRAPQEPSLQAAIALGEHLGGKRPRGMNMATRQGGCHEHRRRIRGSALHP